MHSHTTHTNPTCLPNPQHRLSAAAPPMHYRHATQTHAPASCPPFKHPNSPQSPLHVPDFQIKTFLFLCRCHAWCSTLCTIPTRVATHLFLMRAWGTGYRDRQIHVPHMLPSPFTRLAQLPCATASPPAGPTQITTTTAPPTRVPAAMAAAPLTATLLQPNSSPRACVDTAEVTPNCRILPAARTAPPPSVLAKGALLAR